jgi:hypothetical protein
VNTLLGYQQYSFFLISKRHYCCIAVRSRDGVEIDGFYDVLA